MLDATSRRRLIDRSEIEELITERGRAADAKDADRILACHVPGSSDRHGIFDGTIEEFVEYLRQHHYQSGRYGRQRHYVSNLLVEFEGDDRARAESYHLAQHELFIDGQRHVALIGGRYLDVLSRHDARWLLAERGVVYDWSWSYRQSSPVPEATTETDAPTQETA